MRQLSLLASIAWRNLWRNPRRTVITLLVVAVGLWSILVFAALLKAWSESSRDTTLKLMTGEVEVHATGYLDNPTVAHRMALPRGALARLLDGPSIAGKALRVRVSGIVQSEYKTLPITFVGAAPDQERTVSVIPSQIVSGHYLAGTNDEGLVIGRKLAERLKTRVGKRVVVMVQDSQKHLAERAFRVVGLFAASEQAENEFVFAGLGPVRRLTRIGESITEIAAETRSASALSNLMESLRHAAPHLDIQSWETLAPLSYAVSTFFNQFVLLWLWVMFALMAIGIVNTQLMAVFERMREFGLVEALGMRPRLVLFGVALESAWLVGLGALLGVAVAVLSVRAFSHGLDLGFLGRGAELVGAGRVLYPRADVADFTTYTLVVWTLGVLATLWPAWRASRVSPVVAMRRQWT